MSYAKNSLKMDDIDRLLDALEHPERYSDREIEACLSNPEAKELLEVLDKTESSLRPIPTPVIETEWQLFEQTRIPRRPRRRTFFFNRNIAAGLIIAIAASATVAAVIGAKYSISTQPTSAPENMESSDSTVPTSCTETITPIENEATTAPATIIFDNETLETIVTYIADYYGYRTEFASDESKSLRMYFRWNQTMTPEEVVESINNFDRIQLSIDNKCITIR